MYPTIIRKIVSATGRNISNICTQLLPCYLDAQAYPFQGRHPTSSTTCCRAPSASTIHWHGTSS